MTSLKAADENVMSTVDYYRFDLDLMAFCLQNSAIAAAQDVYKDLWNVPKSSTSINHTRHIIFHSVLSAPYILSILTNLFDSVSYIILLFTQNPLGCVCPSAQTLYQ